MRFRGIIIMIAAVLTNSLQAQTVAKYAGEFMSIGVGGRALGMGSAHAALVSDATAGYWNPGALVRIDYPEAIIMHDERFGGMINYEYAGIAIPYGPDVSLGVSVLRLGIDGIADTRNAWIDGNGNGIFDDLDRLDRDKITYFNAADWAFYFTYARRASGNLSYGANVKLIRRDLAEHSATGIGFDAGVLYSPLANLYLGATAQDITTTLVAWTTGRNELISPTLKIGFAYFVDLLGGRLAPAADFDLRFENRRYASIANLGPISIDPHLGLEFDYKSTAALRVGYNDVKQLTLGAGVHLRMLDIDYSFAEFTADEALGKTHRISLRFILQNERYARAPR